MMELDEPPMFSDVHPAHAKGGVAIGTEVDCIGGANDQTNAIQGKSPDKNLRNMQVEHQEDRPSELNCGGKESVAFLVADAFRRASAERESSADPLRGTGR